jgi:hypothetical protein
VVARIGALASRDSSGSVGEVDQLSSRLELGIPRDILWLAKEVKRGLERGDYLALRRAGLSSIEAIKAEDDVALERIVNSKPKLRQIRAAVERINVTDAEDTKDLPMPTPAPDV